jgi:hypothetical protein
MAVIRPAVAITANRDPVRVATMRIDTNVKGTKDTKTAHLGRPVRDSLW